MFKLGGIFIDTIKKEKSLFDKIMDIYMSIGGAIIGLIAVIVMITVILRYFFSITFIWVEEFVTFTFVFTTFFGVGICLLKNEHISVDYLFSRLRGRKRVIVGIINNVIVIVVSFVVLMNSFGWINAVGNQISDGLRVEMRYVYFIMPFSMVITIICGVIKAITDVKEYKIENKVEE